MQSLFLCLWRKKIEMSESRKTLLTAAIILGIELLVLYSGVLRST